jgi:hypothetical protein
MAAQVKYVVHYLHTPLNDKYFFRFPLNYAEIPFKKYLTLIKTRITPATKNSHLVPKDCSTASNISSTSIIRLHSASPS